MNQTMQHDSVGSPVAQDYGEALGTPFKVFLWNGVKQGKNEATGKVWTEFTDLPGLIAAILQVRVLHPRKLSGDDLKFIRSALGMRSGEVASVLDVSPEHYSRCEAGVKTLSTAAEKLYRMYVFLEAASKHVAVQAELSEQKEIDCDPEEAKEAVQAFRRVFLDMKIQHVYPAGDDLIFELSLRRRAVKRRGKGKDDKKWREPEQKAA